MVSWNDEWKRGRRFGECRGFVLRDRNCMNQTLERRDISLPFPRPPPPIRSSLTPEDSSRFHVIVAPMVESGALYSGGKNALWKALKAYAYPPVFFSAFPKRVPYSRRKLAMPSKSAATASWGRVARADKR